MDRECLGQSCSILTPSSHVQMEYEGERWVQGAEAQAVDGEVEAKANALEVKADVQEAE